MGFAEGRCDLRAVWLHTAEPVGWIAARSAAYLDGLTRQLGIGDWSSPYGKRSWPDTLEGREQMVREGVYRDENQVAQPRSGYSLTLNGSSEVSRARVQVEAGYLGVGRNIPAHIVDVRFNWEPQASPTSAQLDRLVALTVQVWEPVMVSFTAHELARSDWRIDPGWRVWLRNDVGRFDTLAEGVSAVELDGGTLLRAPEEWTPEQVKAAVGGTLEANGLAVLPFDEA